MVAELSDRPEPTADDGGGDHRAQDRQHQHWERVAPQLADVDVKRAGEDQEGQHAVHDDGAEIDLTQNLAEHRRCAVFGQQRVECDQHERGYDAHDQEPDGMGQQHKFAVQPAENSR